MDIFSFFIKKVISEIYSELKSYLKSRNLNFLTDEKFIRETILYHINYVNNWSMEVDFSDLDNPKTTSKIYVQLDYYLNVRRKDLQKLKRKQINLKKVFNNDN